LAPNPATDRITLTFKAPLQKSDAIRVYGADGKLLEVIDLGDQVGSFTKGLTLSESGLYYVQYLQDKKSITKKLVIN
ncbi:MAG: T9SS type A sorting domain-containing protein, partial [Saprospiraceae bacterium]|nr:T9SS type A sorting domain-containing protein [Saprospiraceae bacterium]